MGIRMCTYVCTYVRTYIVKCGGEFQDCSISVHKSTSVHTYLRTYVRISPYSFPSSHVNLAMPC